MKVEIIHYTMVQMYKICWKNYDIFIDIVIIKSASQPASHAKLVFLFHSNYVLLFLYYKKDNLGIFQ